MRFAKLLLLALLLVSCAGPTHKNSPSEVKIVLVHSNDIHGRSWPFTKGDGQLYGGYAAQASIIKKIRNEANKEGAIFFLFSSGDVNTGVPESDFSEAKPDFEAMKALGYDAMAIGNHDLDHGLPLLRKQFTWAGFPFLAANLKRKKDLRPVFRSRILINKQNLRFGVVGITTDQLKKLILPQHTKDLEVEDGIRAAQKEVAEVRQEGADVIILLSHLGLSGTGTSQYTQIENDDRKLAKEIPQIDVILGGHSHTELFDGLKVGNTLIAQAGYRGVYIGKVDLVWDTEKSKVVSSRAQLIPVLPSESEDPQIKQIVDPYKKRFEKELGVPIFETRVPLIGLRIDSPTPELSLGNFVCDALKEETGSEVAFFNSGGIRSSIPKGIVRKRDVLEAFPFRNQVTTGILKGSEIIDLLTDGSREVMSGGGVLQVSGLNYEVVNGAVTHVEVNGKPIEPKTDYLFATNSFVSAGGDKLKTMLKARKLRTLSLSVDEALIRFGKKQKISEATTEGRIIVRNESD